MHFSAPILSALCMLVTGIYAGAIEGEHGIDVGNNFCMGACHEKPSQLACKTTESLEFRPEKGCYMCCYSDDNVDAFADNL